jgi:microcin C transport system substrate-binding protein
MNRPAALTALLLSALMATGAATAAETYKGHGIAMHGDLKYPAGFRNFAYVNPMAPKGGTVRLDAIGSYDSFNGFIIKGQPAILLGLIYDSLMTASLDEPFSEYCLLCETVEMPRDRSWVAFTLRANAKWHDGQPVTVEDVIWTFNTLREKGDPFYRFYYANVTKVQKTGERSVKFTFQRSENRELPLIIGQLPVLPKHYWEDRDFEATTLEPPLGSGPYRIETFEPGRSITYARVPDYWGARIPVNVGLNNFDTIRYDYYRDSTVAIEAFKSGAIDYRAENSSRHWATSYNVPAVRDGRIKKETLPHGRSAGMQGFAFNLRRPIFEDRMVRKALAHWSNKTLFYGQYTRTRSFFQNSELAATGVPQGREREILAKFGRKLPREVLTTEYNPPATDGSGNNRAQLREALEILRGAGWDIDEEGIPQADPQEIEAGNEIRGAAGQPAVRAGRAADEEEPRASRHRYHRAHRRHRPISGAAQQLRFRHDRDDLGPVAVARQRAAEFLGLRRRGPARQPEFHGDQGPGGGRSDRTGDRGADSSGAGPPDPGPRPRPAMAAYRHPAAAHPL